MARDSVKVRILDYPGLNTGCACCGPGTCGPEYFSIRDKSVELKEALDAAFPGKASVDYVDLLLSPEEKMSDNGQLLAGGKYPSPLVFIDGEALFAGSIQISRIVKEVGKILEG